MYYSVKNMHTFTSFFQSLWKSETDLWLYYSNFYTNAIVKELQKILVNKVHGLV